ncbi:MAG: TetR/AcrR family transcriptional regulator [Acidimicrobiales bacterium]
MDTRERILVTATTMFGARGYEATSLDAVADELGIRKQTILYHYPSKERLLEAVVDAAVADLVKALDAAVGHEGDAFERVEAVVRAVFRLAVRRPAVLGLLREITRLGDPWTTRVATALEPMVDAATASLAAAMDDGDVRRCDPRLLLVSVYSTVVGVATEIEVLRAVGIEPTLRETVRRRAELLGFLRSALR